GKSVRMKRFQLCPFLRLDCRNIFPALPRLQCIRQTLHDAAHLSKQVLCGRKRKPGMTRVMVYLYMLRRRLEAESAGIELSKSRTDGDQQVAFPQYLLHYTQTGNAAQSQWMIVGKRSFAA